MHIKTLVVVVSAVRFVVEVRQGAVRSGRANPLTTSTAARLVLCHVPASCRLHPCASSLAGP